MEIISAPVKREIAAIKDNNLENIRYYPKRCITSSAKIRIRLLRKAIKSNSVHCHHRF
jgi:hypothetical protein